MSTIGWASRRTSKTNRISYTQFLSELGAGRQSQSIERTSRIPLRSSSQSGRDKGLQNQPKQRSKSQVPTGSSETPLSHGKYTPQIGSKVTSGTSSITSSKKTTYYKDPRNLQDKEFLKEALHLVQNYFQEKCPDILINNSEIKPMTIKMFIAMINHLFDVLGILDKGVEPVKFAVSTYEKELPYWMKKLNYPGLITKAWLQTVNVPQYWPHVIGLLSWLVKLCSVNSMFNMEEQLNVSIDYLNQWWAVFYFKKSMEAFRYYNEGKEQEYKDLCTEMILKFKEINGVDESVLKEIKGDIAELNKKIEDPALLADKDAYDELEQQLAVLNAQHVKLVDDIDKKEIYIQELKNKIGKTEKNHSFIRREIDEVKNDIERLKGTIARQPISVEDIADIQRKTGYLDKEIKCLEKECGDYSQLLSRYEVDAAEVRDKILQSSHAFNRNIIQLEQMIPELKEFHIHVDLENENVVTCMEEMVKSMETLKSTYIEKYQSLEDNLMESERNITDKKKILKELQNSIKNQENKNEAKKLENVKLQKSLEEKEKVVKEELKTWSEKITVVEDKMKEVECLKERKKKAELRHKSLTETLEKKEMFWVEFWNKIEEKWSAIPDGLELLLDMVNKQNEELEAAIDKEKKVQEL